MAAPSHVSEALPLAGRARPPALEATSKSNQNKTKCTLASQNGEFGPAGLPAGALPVPSTCSSFLGRRGSEAPIAAPSSAPRGGNGSAGRPGAWGWGTRAAWAAVDTFAALATGTVKVGLYKGNVLFQSLTGVKASLYFEENASMEDAQKGLNPVSSQGFAEIQSVEARSMAKAGQIK